MLGKFGWREYWLSNGKDILKINSKIAPIQSFLGVLGTTGLTAYVGLVLAVTGWYCYCWLYYWPYLCMVNGCLKHLDSPYVHQRLLLLPADKACCVMVIVVSVIVAVIAISAPKAKVNLFRVTLFVNFFW